MPPNEFQLAIAEGVAALQETHGEVFAFGEETFTAWPVGLFEEKTGALASASDSVQSYQAIEAIAPDFSDGAKLVTAAGRTRRVIHRYEGNETTGLFLFTVT